MPGQPEPWVELRVHGVSGTLVENMLDVPKGFTERVFPAGSGDGRAGFHQRMDAHHAVVGADADGRILEAYHWGEYTEGRPGQGLWIVLVPFGVVNAAQFMLPAPADGKRWAHAIAGACLRIVALVLTGMAVLAIAFVAMDRLAWRAVAPAGSARLWALALAACAPILVLGWLRRVGTVKHLPGQSGLGRNPALDDDPEPPDRRQAWSAPPSGGAMTDAPGGMGSSYFYVGSPLTPARTDAPTLRNLHLAFAIGLVAVLLAWPAASGHDGLAQTARAVALAFLAVLVAVLVGLGDPEELASPRLAPGGWRTARRRWHLVVFLAAPWALGFAVAEFVFAEVADVVAARRHVLPGVPPSDALPGINGIAFALLVAGLAAVLVMIVMCAILGGAGATDGRERGYQRYARGTTAALAAAIGLFLGIAYTGGFVTTLDIVVNAIRPVDGSSRGMIETWVTLPNVVRHIEIAWVCTALLTLAVAAVLIVRYRVVRGRLREAAVRDFARPQAGGVTLEPAVVNTIALRMFVARLKTLIPHVFVLYAGAGVLLTVAAGSDLQGGVNWFDHVPGLNWWVLTGAALLIAITGLVAWVMARGTETSVGFRRGANTVWDVVSFWPRSIHPFVPVAYSQFVVAELRRRISHHIRCGRSVVLAGHSQGSLISLAALLWVPTAERERVGFLSFGSQIRQMFSHAFPAYVDTEVMTWVWGEYGQRWRNLYRDTDHLAGPALSWDHRTTADDGQTSCHWPYRSGPKSDGFLAPTGTRKCGPDWRLLDPRVPTAGAGTIAAGSAQATLHCHSDYWTDPDWPRAVAVVRGAVVSPQVGG